MSPSRSKKQKITKSHITITHHIRPSRDRGETDLEARDRTESKAFIAEDRDEAEAYQLRGETEQRHTRDRGVRPHPTPHHSEDG